MAQINSNYPEKCSNKEIKELMKGFREEIHNQRAHINTVLQFAPLIQLGISELNSRQSKKNSWISIGLGVVSLAVAGIALLISLQNTKFDGSWKTKQLNSLERINQTANQQGEKLNILQDIKNQVESIDEKINKKLIY